MEMHLVRDAVLCVGGREAIILSDLCLLKPPRTPPVGGREAIISSTYAHWDHEGLTLILRCMFVLGVLLFKCNLRVFMAQIVSMATTQLSLGSMEQQCM